ncbi:tryptophan--tRNA ligase [bacterium]|nr:tryptophan--tRNA ligase [bacterium]
MAKKKRILSGMRPTGKLHLGNLVGALENWVRLQDDYENFHLVADWHTLTTDYEHSRDIPVNIIEMVMDWLACGIDPEKSPVFVQSHIKQHAELHLIFSMLVTQARLERNPTLKEQVRDLSLETRMSYGHIGYPILQAADILIYKGEFVPVGEDQVPHIELSREIARRFNTVYSPKHPVFPEPEPMLTKFPRFPGVDGNRMSKSLGNTLLISDTPDTIRKTIKTAVTDPQKVRRGDPGHPDICLIFTYHNRFNKEEIPEIRAGCESGALGCVDCKTRCTEKIIEYLEPIHQKRIHYEKHPKEVLEIIEHGDQRARKEAERTMAEVYQAMGM